MSRRHDIIPAEIDRDVLVGQRCSRDIGGAGAAIRHDRRSDTRPGRRENHDGLVWRSPDCRIDLATVRVLRRRRSHRHGIRENTGRRVAGIDRNRIRGDVVVGHHNSGVVNAVVRADRRRNQRDNLPRAHVIQRRHHSIDRDTDGAQCRRQGKSCRGDSVSQAGAEIAEQGDKFIGGDRVRNRREIRPN